MLGARSLRRRAVSVPRRLLRRSASRVDGVVSTDTKKQIGAGWPSLSALYELYVLEEDHESLAAGVVEYTNFDSIEMAQMCEKHALLQFRRIGAMLYKKGQKWSQSVALSKQDKVWDEAIATTSESGDAALAEDAARVAAKAQT